MSEHDLSPPELAQRSNIVEIIGRTEEQVHDVLFGDHDGGLAAHLHSPHDSSPTTTATRP